MNLSATDAKSLRTHLRVRHFLESIVGVLQRIKVRRRKRCMSLCETLPLGDKRFLAIVEIDQRRLLIAATGQSISLLERLDATGPQARPETTLPHVLREEWR